MIQIKKYGVYDGVQTYEISSTLGEFMIITESEKEEIKQKLENF